MHTKFWSENLKGRGHAGKLERRWKDNIRMYLRETGWKVSNGFIWLRIRTSGGLL